MCDNVKGWFWSVGKKITPLHTHTTTIFYWPPSSALGGLCCSRLYVKNLAHGNHKRTLKKPSIDTTSLPPLKTANDKRGGSTSILAAHHMYIYYRAAALPLRRREIIQLQSG